MSGSNKSPKNDQHSNKYRWIQHEDTSFKANLSHVDCSPSFTTTSNENKQCYKNSQLKSPEILSTAQLISSIGQIWDSVSRPLSFPKESADRDDKGFPKEKILGCIDGKKKDAVTSNNTNYYPVNMGATGFGSQIVWERLDFPKVTQKMLIHESCNGSQDYIHSLFQRFLQSSDKNSNECRKEMELKSEEISFRSSNVCWWASRNAPNELKCLAKSNEPENLKASSLVARDCISIDTSTTASANESDVCSPDVITHAAPPLSNCALLNTQKVNPLHSDCFLQPVPDNQVDVGACEALSSCIYADSLATCHGASVQCQHKIDDNEIMEIQRRHLLDLTENEPKVQIFSATDQKPSHSLAKQEHAFSGALAGLCVSLCLHPVDTIKTVIQSCRADQRSIFYIGKSIVSDRGFPALYRGITTNIACSAPISAVYTFTYESVKSALLPYLPKEYYSFAHCVGGGSASIATSFIFTPSERIKQQMQVGSHYRNCWDVLVGIIRNGGLSSLYAGWRAVLCRNIPHSIIKLVCGGLAGSTAALFTTPFDVIKTRLQTQIPGSVNQYDSVLHALYKISKSEGLKGLYRGLTPRLIMYMSQGSLFFASYEFFKRGFSLEASIPAG